MTEGVLGRRGTCLGGGRGDGTGWVGLGDGEGGLGDKSRGGMTTLG